MGFIDIVLIVIVGAFVLFGLFFGLVHTLGSLLGTIVGIIFASRLVDPAFETFGFLFGGGTFAGFIIFILIFFHHHAPCRHRVLDIRQRCSMCSCGFRLPIRLIEFLGHCSASSRALSSSASSCSTPCKCYLTIRCAQAETSVVADFLIATMSVLQVFFREAAQQAVESAADSTAEVIPEPVAP